MTRLNIRTESTNIDNFGTFKVKGLAFEQLPKTKGINSISSDKSKEFPSPIGLIPIGTLNRSLPKVYYENTSVPYIAHEQARNLDIWYVNLYPIANKLEIDPQFAEKVFPQLGNLLMLELPYEYRGSEKDIRTLVNGGVIAFQSLNSTGHFKASSSSRSAIFEPVSKSMEIIVDKKSRKIDGIESIAPISGKEWLMTGSNISTHGGYGYYLTASSKNLSASYYGLPARIILKENHSDTLISGENITVKIPNSYFTLRQPMINISGNAFINNLYAYGELSNKIRSLGNRNF
jgi:hypothetical protein